ncbi:MAG: winged helix-turn-helix domain-containing protein [Clostridiales bacterium]|nr:winged helix-turn-helix domain-containing protein [Clostridiales bacterium]
MSTMLSIYPKEEKPALLAINDDEKVVYVNGQPCELTQQEFSLLQELAQNIDRPVSREELLRSAWGYICPGETRTVDVHVQRLRKKLGFSCIETVYRRGYKLRAQEVY